MHQKILAFSSSKEGSGAYLETAIPVIDKFLGDTPLKIAFIPFASVDTRYERYTEKVRNALKGLPHIIETVTPENAITLIEKTDVLMVGGGNTFKLLYDLYALQLISLIKQKINKGTPYIGWSAGANLCGPSIRTSNDMPIIDPGSFEAFGFFPFQINPHYYNQPIAGFNGETREQRLTEFLQLNPSSTVVALPEGTALLNQDNRITLIGNAAAFLFTWEDDRPRQQILAPGSELNSF